MYPFLSEVAIKLTNIDYGVVWLYIVTLVAIGGYVSYKNRKSEDLFLGGKTMGWGNVGLSLFGTNISPTFLIVASASGFVGGIYSSNFEWLAFIFIFLLGMVFIPFYLDTKITTMPEFLKKRFGNNCYSFMSFYSLIAIVMAWSGGTLYAGGLVLKQLIGWELETCVILLAVIAVGFTIAGGLVAVMVTDSFQSVLMIVGVLALTIIMAFQLDSLEQLLDVHPRDIPKELAWDLFHPHGSVNPWYTILLGYPVLALSFWCADQTIVQRVLGAKNLKHAQKGTLFVGFLKILPPFIFFLPGIMAAVLLPEIENEDEVFLTIVSTYMPVGFVGLIVAVLISAVVSTLDSALNSFSTIFTLDIYKRWIGPESSEHKIKQVGRIVTVFAGVISIFMALWLDEVNNAAEKSNLFELFQKMIANLAPPISAVFAIGILWKKMTSKAALVALWGGALISLSLGYLQMNPDSQGWFDAGQHWYLHWLLITFYIFLFLCLLIVVVSLFTKHSEEETVLPSLRETYRRNPGIGKSGFVCWGILATIMVTLYLVFNLIR